MSKNKKLVPKRRFKEFQNTDAWEQRELGEVTIINPQTSLPNVFEYVDLESVVGTEMISHRTEEKSSAPSRAQRLAKQGDIFYQTVRPYQKNNYLFDKLDNNYVFSTGYAQLRPEINSDFLMNYIQDERFVLTVLSNCTGTSYPAISPSSLSKIMLNIPINIGEQEKVGTFFATLDQTLVFQQRKLEKMKSMKSAYWSEMFPAEGERKPKRRFPGFTDDWEQRELGEVVQITMGQSPLGSNYTENPSDYILVQGNADMKNGKVFPRIWTTQVTKTAEPDDIILSVRAPVGDVGKTDYNVVLGRGVAGIKGNEFIYQLLSKMKSDSYWGKYSTGSTFDAINSNDLKEANICIPSTNEQVQIGSFFRNLDQTIAFQQQKLEKLQNIKKAYLNEMFI